MFREHGNESANRVVKLKKAIGRSQSPYIIEGPNIRVQTLQSANKRDQLNPDLNQIMSYRGSDDNLVSHQGSAEMQSSRSPRSHRNLGNLKTPQKRPIQIDPLMQSFGVNALEKPDSMTANCVEFTTIDQLENDSRRKRPKVMTSVVDGLMKKSLNLISESRNRFLSRSFKKVDA